MKTSKIIRSLRLFAFLAVCALAAGGVCHYIFAQNKISAVPCVYEYGDWDECDANGRQTRTVISVYPSGADCFDAPATEQSCNRAASVFPCTGYDYGVWSGCKSDGTQTRSIIASVPSGCFAASIDSVVPEILRKCTICAYAYSDWSACNSEIRTRSIVSRTPAGCVLPTGISETATQSCSSQTACSYSYGLWATTCDASGNRTRPYQASPAGCYQATAPYISEPCNSVECASYAYSDWSACNSGIQTRSIVSKLPAGCTGMGSATLSRNCSSSVPCVSYTYDAWNACSADGTQSRSIIAKYPAGCVDDSASLKAILKQACAVLLPCTSYTYSDWSACGENGTQSRKVLTKEPSGCNGSAPSSELTRSCAYLPCKSHAYGSWSGCDSFGKQSRKVILSLPAGCTGGEAPVLERNCDNNASQAVCEYEYSDWGSCGPAGVQTRKIISVRPDNCAKDSALVLEQKCDYLPLVSPVAAADGSVADEQKFPCEYSYSAWGACVSKRQARMLISAAPAGCDASAAPELERDCNESAAVLPAMAEDAPAPVPSSMLSAAPAALDNFNGRTDPQWQNYYFGSADCREEKKCGGAADPDNDGLNNNDEYRFGANPNSPDTDRDGMVDGDEIQSGRNPLAADTATSTDVVVYENPKEKGRELIEIYQASGVKYDAGKKELTITGRALPDSYVTIYIYSDPIVLTVKTDSDGNWSYVLDKPMEEGSHEVYVAVNDNAGRIIAKSAPLVFAQTAEAATITYPAMAATEDKAPAPTKARLWEGYFIFFGTAIGGLLLALAAIGLARSIHGAKNDNKQ